MRRAFLQRAALAVFSACLTAPSAMQSAATAAEREWGTPSALGHARAASARLALGNINRVLTFANASFATGAVGLRNRGEGGIEVSGITTPVRAARLYWAVITQGPPTSAQSNVSLRRGIDGPVANIIGFPVGQGGSPCWGGDRITVYRGFVPLTVANGNGLYTIELRAGANGLTNGASPWQSSPPPMVEGASLVLIGAGNATVSIYDIGLAGRTFFGQLTYSLSLSGSVEPASEVLFHTVGADGQVGIDVDADRMTAVDMTRINGRHIAGPFSPAVNSDWNGAVAGPLPQLWDDTTHDVTIEAKAGSDPTALPVIINAPDDCIVPVANIVSID